jgi:tRNA G26 N,N-dimethylase Trm1
MYGYYKRSSCNGKIKWIVINYNLPTEPSRPRVAIWRGLKKIGAVNVQQSMWVLPYNKENYSALEKISQDIELNNGETLLMESKFFDDRHEERVIALVNQKRNEEYLEFINECEKYLRELEKEITIKKFTFAELEEEEEELQKSFPGMKKSMEEIYYIHRKETQQEIKSKK